MNHIEVLVNDFFETLEKEAMDDDGGNDTTAPPADPKKGKKHPLDGVMARRNEDDPILDH